MPDPQALDPERFDVLAQAIGDVESQFSARISAELVRHADVARAYLAIASIHGAQPEVVLALAFRSEFFDQRTIEACTNVFREQFSTTEALAIVPLNENLETKFGDMRPFYIAAGVN